MNHLVNVISIVMAAIVGWFLYSIMLDRAPPVAIGNDPIVLSTQPVPRLGALQIRYKVTVARACRGVSVRKFVDASGTALPIEPYGLDSGVRSDGQVIPIDDPFDQTVSATVPNTAAPGQATYQNEATFYCNFWQRVLRRGITVDYPQVVFDVGEKTLPQVSPSQSIFKRTGAKGDFADWFRRHIFRVVSEDE